jgi:hypothetical protein
LIISRKFLEKTHCCLGSQRFQKKIINNPGDQSIGHSQRYTQINYPSLKVPAELLASILASARRSVSFVAKFAIAHHSSVPDNGLAASTFAESQVNE